MSNEGDLQYYIANKALVNDVKQGPAIKRSGPFAGLRNHGATCYLNSLIQCLFHDKDFVKLVLETNDNKDSPIIAELQKLFARLMLSSSQAIDTEQLLAAFGWSKSQMFEQHDIHELFSVLLDALGKESNHLNSEISKLFQGRLNDVLTCSSCAHVSRTASTFLNFSLDMPESDAATRCELRDLIRTHLQPEVLDAENMWQCSGCNEKVRASKGQEYLQLPGMMMLHLKRFRYDPALKRRRKLTTPVHFPLTLDANDLFTPIESEPKKGSYRLTGVVLHSGTAMGGHYRCYVYTVDPVTSVPVWVDCNDANVTVLTEEDVNKMLAPPQSVDEAVAPKGSFVHDNVYMLLYKEVQDAPVSTTEELKQLFSAQVVEEIERENASFSERIRLQEIKAQVVDLTVRIHPIDTPVENSAVSVQLDVYQQTTLAAALAQVHALLVSTNKLDGAVYPLEHCRLRKYGKRSSTILGESFEGREGSVTLQDISLHGAATLGLEVRTTQDAAFVEFNPFDMNLTFTVWSAETDAVVAENATGAPGVKKDVLVPGREASTVGALREAVAQSLQVATSCVLLIHDDPAKPIELLSVDSNTLVAQHQIYPGDISVVVEVLPPETFASVAFPLLENKRKQAVIYYNNPLTSTSAGAVDEQPTEADASSTPASAANRDGTYSQSIEVSLDLTLAAVKALIAPTLNITDLNSFFCKRSGAASVPQLKDENKTLKELAFVSHSVLHLQMGPGCKVGEHMVRVEIDTSSPTSALQALDPTATSSATTTSTASAGIAGGVAEAAGGIAGAAAQVFVALGDVAVSEKLSVLQLKQLLCDQWSALASRLSPTDAAAVPTPISANHIRLRDGKAGKSSGPLRDDRIVGRCLLGLADGRRLVAQVLSEAEFISADDLVISLRVASFERKVLYPAIDLPITRTSTIKALYEKILALVPQLNEPLPAEYIESVPAEPEYQETISIAKGFTTGPALTLKSAFKLKWDDPAVLKALVDPTAASVPAPAPAPTAVSANPAATAGAAEGEEEGTMDPAGVPTDGLLNNPFGLDRPPLNLRDGSIVVVRSKADFWRVEQVLKARRAEEIAAGGDGAPRRPTTAGTGVAAARNRKSVKARVAAANAGMMASESGGEDEVLVKGAPQKSNNGIVRSGTENSLKIATGGSNKAEE